MKEQYGNMSLLLENIICEELEKWCTVEIGKFSLRTLSCSICSRESSDKRKSFDSKSVVIEKQNIINSPLVNHNRILLSPLHIKLSMMKQSVKVLDKYGECFAYLSKKLLA